MSETALPEGVFPSIRADYEAHDKTCLSLRYMWLGRKCGVSCLSDFEDCADCGVTFYLEGVAWLNHEAEDEDEIWVCGCCALKRGVPLRETTFGVTSSPEEPA